ncbi:hypothetical protein MPTK1_6g07970 [Marchantia polymorpha subsp. ruderalis]|uniref:Uncharacterized protein n=2 Tax=Marchantia polymorpha TaxID=3197 RepID=A0AAF6BPQ5_MARPO|nr:hypothetical protein MARPO_0239s0002 [Marchantia polymorpha]BBN13989.1 hypothetical protein Mp_6g07970 [Marchantia polymorpha subsp. ruderalis]|eukprot:PTQ27025.1 hypothetical protein MARPO_0239s0002 [Marchantia polymorpha]
MRSECFPHDKIRRPRVLCPADQGAGVHHHLRNTTAAALTGEPKAFTSLQSAIVFFFSASTSIREQGILPSEASHFRLFSVSASGSLGMLAYSETPRRKDEPARILQ